MMKDSKTAGNEHDHFSLILDCIDSIAYVADVKTNRVIFANKHARNILGDVIGCDCWEKIWNMKSCPYGSNPGDNSPVGEGKYSEVSKRELMNSSNGRWYEISARNIPWNNREARLEVASDITGKKWIEETSRRSKADWENIFDTVDDLITIQDRNFNIIMANRTAEIIFGRPMKEIVKSKCYTLYHGTSAPPAGCLTCRCMESETIRSFEYYEPYLNRYLDTKVIPRLNQNNRIVGLVHIVKDITCREKIEDELEAHRKNSPKLKNAEKELKKENRTLKALSDCNNALLYMKEEKELLNEICRIIVGVAGYRMVWVGYADADEIHSVRPVAYSGFNDNYLETIHMTWDDSELGRAPAGEAIKSGKTSIVRDIVNDPYDGSWRNEAVKRGYRSALAVPLFRDDRAAGALSIYAGEADAFNKENIDLIQKLAGNLSYCLNVCRSNAENELARAESIRASHLGSIGELAAGVAHEINNPINGIINYAQILANKGKADSEENDIANRIIRESDRVASIVRNLLSFARDNDFEKVPTNIGEVLSYTLSLTGMQIHKDGIKLNLKIPPQIPAVAAQPQQLEQVFLNIISNARYALNQKYPVHHPNKILEISIEQCTVNNDICLQTVFHDRGPGIPAGIVNKVMNPFFSTKPSNTGTGLGLSISHGIISEHSGKLNVESIEGEFTRVIIGLPLSVRSRNEKLKNVAVPQR